MTKVLFWLTVYVGILFQYSVKSANLGNDLNNSLSNYFGGKDPNTQWKFFVGSGMVVSNLNWAKDLNWTGFIRGYGDALNHYVFPPLGQSMISLITPKHGITCHHAGLGTYATNDPGWLIRAYGTDGNYYTNLVTQVSVFDSSSVNDIAVITFTTNFPSVVTPFYVLPTNAYNYVVFTNRWMCWYRNNSNHLATTTASTLWNTNIFHGGSDVPGSSFNNNVATGGDSSGPFFFVLGTNLVFVGALSTSTLEGPFVSWPSNMYLIQGITGSSPINFADLSQYTTNVIQVGTLNVRNIHIGGSP